MMRWRRCIVCIVSMLVARMAVAQPKRPAQLKTPHTEVDLFPVLGGTSDVGFGGGLLGAIAREEPGYSPYRWRLAGGSLTMFKPGRHGKRGHLTYQDYYLKLSMPDLARGAVRLDARLSYTRQAPVHYYGIGNASVRLPRGQFTPGYYDYTRVHPTFWLKVRINVGGPFFIRIGNNYTQNLYDIAPDSRLAEDIISPNREVRTLVDHPRDSAVDFFEYALLYDTRDNEVEPSRGQYDKFQLRFSPGGSSHFPYRYAQANLTLRWYTTPIRDHLTVAMRLMGDVLFGHPPLYELSRYDDTSAIGGSRGVRGIPSGRYSGKIKVLGNIEARVPLAGFRLLGKQLRFGVAGFLDAGRVWADTTRHPELDGTSLGLKYGIGGGLRLQQGHSFVLRLDAAWSPDARPMGLYLTAGEAF
jgi:outer membrane protein assembly factor BamA